MREGGEGTSHTEDQNPSLREDSEGDGWRVCEDVVVSNGDIDDHI